jgi:hypothetical protein
MGSQECWPVAFAWEEFYIRELTACRTPTRWIAFTLGTRDRAVLFSVPRFKWFEYMPTKAISPGDIMEFMIKKPT